MTLIASIRSAVERARFDIGYYRAQQAPLGVIVSDAGHAARYYRTQALERIYDLTGKVVDAAREADTAAYDAMVWSGKSWERKLGADTAPDARWVHTHYSWDLCTCPEEPADVE